MLKPEVPFWASRSGSVGIPTFNLIYDKQSDAIISSESPCFPFTTTRIRSYPFRHIAAYKFNDVSVYFTEPGNIFTANSILIY